MKGTDKKLMRVEVFKVQNISTFMKLTVSKHTRASHQFVKVFNFSFINLKTKKALHISDHIKRPGFKLRHHHPISVHNPYTASYKDRGFNLHNFHFHFQFYTNNISVHHLCTASYKDRGFIALIELMTIKGQPLLLSNFDQSLCSISLSLSSHQQNCIAVDKRFPANTVG